MVTKIRNNLKKRNLEMYMKNMPENHLKHKIAKTERKRENCGWFIRIFRPKEVTPEFQQIPRRKSCHFQSTENMENVPSLIYEANITSKIRLDKDVKRKHHRPT